VPDLGCRVGQHRPTHFSDVFPGSQACVRACIVTLEQYFCWILARPNSPETFLELVEGVDVCLWVNGRTSYHHIHKNESITIPKDHDRSWSSVSALPDALTLLAHRPTVLLLTAQLPYTAHKCLWMFSTLRFCEPRIQLQLVAWNGNLQQTPF
jgi:hypothetical protein